jgi:predicted acetyltransferase
LFGEVTLAIELRIDQARPEEKEAVRNLLQLYQYDFSEIAGGVVLDDGLFPYHANFDAEWGRLCPRTFLLRAFDIEPRGGEEDWRLAGFAMVTEGSSSGQNAALPLWQMEEFFVLRKYRRVGAGRHLAMHCFERFPGRWEVGEVRSNTVAQAFWRAIIAEHTNGRFEEVIREDGLGWVVQLFDNTTVNRGNTSP